MLLVVKCINLNLQRFFSKSKSKLTKRKFSMELQRTVRTLKGFQRISNYTKFEILSANYFSKLCNRTEQMREGHLKQSYIYMLIDPRISQDLPTDSIGLNNFATWKRFLHSIFYVGKGKTTRPYAHLYDAIRTYEKQDIIRQTKGESNINGIFGDEKRTVRKSLSNRKLERILSIWESGSGVVCLQAFHHILPTEAYTREAAIIDALSLVHLTNERRGDYYGPARAWSMKGKTLLGITLLYKAMQIYLAEGEVQLLPTDII